MSRRIAIVGGTGPEGRGLAVRWARAGESIIIGSRDLERARRAAEDVVKEAGASGRVEAMANADAVAATHLVVLTVPFSAHAETLQQLKT
ncbi:MAG: NAD(P)-binding domain-containing protein, partial [Nevskiales bacterium]